MKANTTLQHEIIVIKEKENTCHKINNQVTALYESFPDPCSELAIVVCEGNDECEFSISFVGDNSGRPLPSIARFVDWISFSVLSPRPSAAQPAWS